MQVTEANIETTPRVRILVVDDDPQVLASLKRTLKFNYDGEYASSAEQAIAILKADPSFALILTDMRMPGLNGVDLLVESLKYAPKAIRIVISGYTDYDSVIEAINRGNAHRFIPKPFEPDQLVRALEESLRPYRLERERDVLLQQLAERNASLVSKERELERLVAERTSQLEQANRVLRDLVRDVHTGLFNRRYMNERMTSEIARARRHGHALSLLLVGIDGLAVVNDQHGLEGGNVVIDYIATLLVKGVDTPSGPMRGRISDVTARFSADIFALILPETPVEGARIKAERVRDAVAQQKIEIEGVDTPVSVTVSIGLSALGLDGEDSKSVIESAEKALATAKQNGRNRVVGRGR